jgi:hypothetical protein
VHTRLLSYNSSPFPVFNEIEAGESGYNVCKADINDTSIICVLLEGYRFTFVLCILRNQKVEVNMLATFSYLF